MRSNDLSEWPGIFNGTQTVEQRMVDGRCEIEGKLTLLADIHNAWGMCMSGQYTIPEAFGMGMVNVSRVFENADIQPGPGLNRLTEEYSKKHEAKYGR